MKKLGAALLLGLTFCGTASIAADQAILEGYLCCNVHFEKDVVNDINWSNWRFLPAGTPAKVLSFESGTALNIFGGQANVEIDGKIFRIANSYGRRQESIESYTRKLIIPADPTPIIQAMSEKVRQAVKAGKVIRGMSREEVLISLGYPSTHYTPSIDDSVWHYWALRREPYDVHFDDEGRVRFIAYPAP